MRLTKTDALFLHKTLYHYSVTATNISADDSDALDDLLDKTSEFLTSNADDDSSEEEEEGEEEEDQEDPDADVSATALTSLASISVLNSDGDKVSLEFDHSSYADAVDALIDGGSMCIEDVDYIKVFDGAVDLHADKKWHSFKLRKKLPASWSKVLEENKLYSVVGDK